MISGSCPRMRRIKLNSVCDVWSRTAADIVVGCEAEVIRRSFSQGDGFFLVEQKCALSAFLENNLFLNA